MMQLEELGRCVAGVQDADRQRLSTAERAGASFLRALRAPPRRPHSWVLAAALAGVASVAGVWLTLSPQGAEGPIQLASGIAVGRSITAPPDREVPLHFSDGSRILLLSGTQAVVESLTDHGAEVGVERGRAKIFVQHRPNTHFTLHAGPYRVSVTGTRFELGWLPDSARFELLLTEGSVVVTTEGSSHAAVTMVAPQHLLIERGDWLLRPSGGTDTVNPAPSSLPPRPRASAVEVLDRSASSIPAAKPSASAEESDVTTPTWQSLGRAGKYELAYRQAAGLGIAQLADTGASPGLLDLAEICRFAGHASEAMSVLAKLRQRFPGTDGAAIAAFQLGRLSGSPGVSARWFRTYLNERPGGELAREASGRLLEALDRSQDHAGAVVAARSYLGAYPGGPHAAFARKLLAP